MRHQAKSARRRSANEARMWWRELARVEWLRRRAEDPTEQVKGAYGHVEDYLKAIADGRHCPGERGIKEARLEEKWDAAES